MSINQLYKEHQDLYVENLFFLKRKKHKTNLNKFTIIKSIAISSQFYV